MPYELLVIGACCYGVACLLDKYMDYGHALGWVRYWVMYWLASDVDRQFLRDAAEGDDFAHRIDYMDKLYMEIVIYRPYLLVLHCKTCMTFWITLSMCVVFANSITDVLLLYGSASIISFIDR